MRTNRLISRDIASDLDLSSRIKLEMQLTDTEGEKIRLRSIPEHWQFEDYWKCSPHRVYLFNSLGSLIDRTILDLGCGYHPTPIYFALAGARQVYACDVSPKAVAHMQKMAEAAGVADRVTVMVCAGEQLPLADETVDIVHGEAVLHHLHISMASREIARVLKKNGKAGFKDPLGQNPLLEFVRDFLPYHWKKSAKGTDSPLTFSKIEEFGQKFPVCTYRGFGLLSLIVLPIWGRGRSKPRDIADVLDYHLLRLLPSLQRFCRFVVTCVEK